VLYTLRYTPVVHPETEKTDTTLRRGAHTQGGRAPLCAEVSPTRVYLRVYNSSLLPGYT